MYSTSLKTLAVVLHRCMYRYLGVLNKCVCVHRFMLKSAPLRKSYVCSFCKNSIKAMQKFVKCSCEYTFS